MCAILEVTLLSAHTCMCIVHRSLNAYKLEEVQWVGKGLQTVTTLYCFPLSYSAVVATLLLL